MKYTVNLTADETMVIEAENFNGCIPGLVIFTDCCNAPVAAIQAHTIVSIKTDAVTEESK